MRYAQKVSGPALVAEMMQAAKKAAAASEMLDVIVSELAKLCENIRESQRLVQASQQIRQDDPDQALVRLYDAYHALSEQYEHLDNLRDKLSMAENCIAGVYTKADKLYEYAMGVEYEDVDIKELIDGASSELNEVLAELSDVVSHLADRASKLREDRHRLIEALDTLSKLLEKHGNVWTQECVEYFREVIYPLAVNEIASIHQSLEVCDSRMQNVMTCKERFIEAVLTAIEDARRNSN